MTLGLCSGVFGWSPDQAWLSGSSRDPDQSRVCRTFVGIVVRVCSEAHLPLLFLLTFPLLFSDRPACCRRPCRAWMVVLATR